MKCISNNTAELLNALEILKKVRDPEIGLNIVDLGLIYQLDFDENPKRIYASMTLTTRFCPMSQSMQNNVLNALKAAYSQHQVTVNLVFDPPWTSANISTEGKNFLNGSN